MTLKDVTLKDVAQQVGVHHTLLNYYFTDKKKLFDAVVARRAGVTIARRMNALGAYDAETGSHPTVEGALRAFLDTDLDLYGQEGGESWKNYGVLGAQLSNTRYGADLMDHHFDPVVLRLIGLLKKALPGCADRPVLGLSLRHRRPDADPGAHGPDRPAVRRPVRLRGLCRGEGPDGHLHGRRRPGHLPRAAGPTRLTNAAKAAPHDPFPEP